jgi:flagellar basal body-associated protein FliL
MRAGSENYDPKRQKRKTLIMIGFLVLLICLVIFGAIFSYFCEPDPEMVAYTKQVLKEREKQARLKK